MGLIYKDELKSGRNMYIYYPNVPVHSPYKVSLIGILRDGKDKDSVEKLLSMGLQKLADENWVILVFPNPVEDTWNFELSEDRPDDVTALDILLQEVTKPDNDPPKTDAIGIPLLSEMIRQWHPMFDCRYLIGMGTGASMAYSYAAIRPDEIAGILGFGGGISKKALEQATDTPVAAVLSGASEETAEYYIKANQAELKVEKAHLNIYENKLNPYMTVVKVFEQSEPSGEIFAKVYRETFKNLRRMNTGLRGDLYRFSDLSGPEFTWYIEDEVLGCGPRTWLVHVPSDLPKDSKVPLVMFCHGGSDTPTEAAHMAKFHELGRKEHFITVYPWGSNRASWNINLLPDWPGDDVEYLTKLIDFMIEKYPVDSSRVYMSGFSNGASMAMVVSMLHPEKVAALAYVDTNWPGNRWKRVDMQIEDVAAMKLALEKKEPWMRMPVWTTYGTREASYPVARMHTQQYQYDFWKMFNNIEVKPTPDIENPDPSGCGVPGDEVEWITPNPMFPNHRYEINRFFTRDPEPQNYYNYVMMHDKGHDVAPSDAELCWNYAKQFKRNPDGTVGRV
ncbi:MAG: esterase [Lachnospiraceae bacterium]|nr:esterase [Lachnospiraceae bacterium]